MTLDPVNQWMKTNRINSGRYARRVTCGNGLHFSAQASRLSYCSPREDDAFPYSEVEIGFPSRRISEFMEWADEPEHPTQTIYAFVPVDVVNAVIAANGGISVAKAGEGA